MASGALNGLIRPTWNTRTCKARATAEELSMRPTPVRANGLDSIQTLGHPCSICLLIQHPAAQTDDI